jgi:hypothetical protein
MAVETASDIASFFDDSEFAEAASYQSPNPGAATEPCLVILDRGQGRSMFSPGQRQQSGDRDFGGTGSNRHLWVQAGDDLNQLADVKRDAIFTIDSDGEKLKVHGLPELDHAGHLWSVQLIKLD